MAGLVYLAQIPSLGPPLLATLDEQSGQPGFLAAANPADGTVTVVPAALLTGGLQQSYELWVIPPGGKPHSLGLIDPKRPVKVVVPPELLPHVSADSTLAISLEPVGGSPTGQPTGPVIANGKLASLVDDILIEFTRHGRATVPAIHEFSALRLRHAEWPAQGRP